MGRPRRGGRSGIKLIRLDPATGKPAEGAPRLSIASHAGGIEPPFILRRGDWYYLFVSFGICCRGAQSTYNIRVGRSTAVTGPYADSRGTPMPGGGGDLLDAGDARWKGPGHNGVFAERDTFFLVNHAYDAVNQGRSTLWIRPLLWSTEGWPTLDRDRGTAVGTVRRGPVRAPRPPGAARDFLGRLPPWDRRGSGRGVVYGLDPAAAPARRGSPLPHPVQAHQRLQAVPVEAPASMEA